MRMFLVLLGVLFLAGCAASPPQGSVERGKALFNDPNLGTTGASCNSCHPNGGTTGGEFSGMKILDLHGAAATFPKYNRIANKIITLAEMNNVCITFAMKGKAIDTNSQEMKDLETYLHSLKK